MRAREVATEQKLRSHLPTILRDPWPLATALALLACLVIAFGANPFASLDRKWGDTLLRLRFRMSLEPKPDPRLFLVGLETNDLAGWNSAASEYQSYAEILDILTDLQVSAVGLDLILERGRPSDAAGVVEAIRKNGHVVLAEALTGATVVRSFMFAEPQFPSGLINIVSDPDGVHRRYSYGVANGSCLPSLALATYLASLRPVRHAKCTETGVLEWTELGPDKLTLVERRLSPAPSLLNFRSPYNEPWDRGFKYIGASDLRAKYKQWRDTSSDPNHMPRGLPARGNLALIGSVATGGGDAGATPFATFEPLVQLHATALDDLLQGRRIKESSPAANIGFTVLCLLLIATAERWQRGIAGALLLCGVLIVFILALSAFLLIRSSVWLAAITPVAFLGLSLIGETARRASVASLEKVQMRQTLGRYFSPNVLKDVLQNPDAMQPREAELTVLLTDVRNFTTITEQSGTKRMFDLLNAIFEVETQAAIGLDGSMEHFVGDQFLAYWGAPQEQPDAADRALEAAAIIIRRLDELHATLEPGVKELFGFGVALHTGKALFGNKGASIRLDYGILGDIVNAAARIESLTKYYGVRQIITREVMEKATKKPPARFLDRIRVKGKAQPLELFEVLIAPDDQKLVTAQRYEAAWQAYARGEFPEAACVFDELKLYDKPSAVLAERCHELIASPPLAWDGGYQFHEK